mgnify:CR=1 FL=1|jgi:hypothetical protein
MSKIYIADKGMAINITPRSKRRARLMHRPYLKLAQSQKYLPV